MKMHPIATLILLISILAGACSSLATSTPVLDLTVDYPLDTKTGIPAVDKVLAAVASGNPEELRSLVQYTLAPCTPADGLGGLPKCGDGEAEGTPLKALPLIGVEGRFIRKSDIGNWQGIDLSAVYAVYQVSEAAQVEEYYPSGEYEIVFRGPPNQPAVSVRIRNGGIVRIDSLFDTSPDGLKIAMERDAAEVILSPKSR